MKILVLGADGFIGSRVRQALNDKYDVHGASRSMSDGGNNHHIDLTDKKSIHQTLKQLNPDVIVNCAGIVDNSDKAALNEIFTSNLLEEVLALKLNPKKIIILGSAAEYGTVKKENIPVNEDAPLNAASPYALSKLKETTTALEFRQTHRLPIVVARIFNPIGAGMPERLLLPSLIKQVDQIKLGVKQSIEVTRLDSQRDYIDVNDVAGAIMALVENDLKHTIYNVGSGRSVSTKELIGIIVRISGLPNSPRVVETSSTPEDTVASTADITRIEDETGWIPSYKIEESIKKVVDG